MAKLNATKISKSNHAYVSNTFGVIVNMQDIIRLEDGTKVTLPHPLSDAQVVKVLSLMSGEWKPLADSTDDAIGLDAL